MKLTNNQIYNYSNALNTAFIDFNQRLPIKVNFYLQKNKVTLNDLAKDIELARTEIIRTHGKYNAETGETVVPDDQIESAIKEINDLFKLEQDVNIYMVKLEHFGEQVQMTPAQMEALLFMIEE